MSEQRVMRRMVERRRRGWVGFGFAALFWLFNFAMAVWMYGVSGKLFVRKMLPYSQVWTTTSEISPPGMMAMMMVLGVWAAGAVVFGALVYATRGVKEVVEVE